MDTPKPHLHQAEPPVKINYFLRDSPIFWELLNFQKLLDFYNICVRFQGTDGLIYRQEKDINSRGIRYLFA